MPKSMLMLTLILIAGFKTCNGTKPNVVTKSSITMNKPTTSTLTLAERPTFASDIRPILQSRCQPCHFQGGQMYEKLPFDKPETITKLGTKLFTRIKNEDQQRVIREFLSKQSATADRYRTRLPARNSFVRRPDCPNKCTSVQAN